VNGELGVTQLGLTELGMTEFDLTPVELLIDNAVQNQTADVPQLSFERILNIFDAVQNQTASSPVFDLNGTMLLISSGVQLQQADSPVFIGPPSTIPALPDFCWPVDTSCCPNYETDFTSPVRARAEALAAQTMRMLTGYRVGGCSITIRPCKPTDCFGQAWHTWADTGYGSYQAQFMPVNLGGEWLNIPCCGLQQGCSCTKVCEIALPGPVGRIDEIRIDGVQVDPATYRVDNGNLLTRIGPDCWPACQDMTAAPGSPNTFTVKYLNAIPVDGLSAYAAGVLACEFAKACSGQDCALPRGATSVARQGVTITLQQASFPDGFTGIPEVDAEIRRWNPHALAATSRVWSPSMARKAPRRTTWQAP